MWRKEEKEQGGRGRGREIGGNIRKKVLKRKRRCRKRMRS